MNTIFISIFLFFFSCHEALAYIDPGTGSIIIQAIIGAIAAVSIFFSNLKDKVKLFISKLSKKNKD